MARATRLTDLQLILLCHAAKRDSGQLHPLPPAAKDDPDRAERELASLLRRELVMEAPAPNKASTWRTADDERIALVLTDKGRAAIGVDDGDSADDAPVAAAAIEVVAFPSPPPRESKQAAVVAMLQRADGATIAEIMAATDWLAHSTRAALTGLRKKGHVIERSKRGDATCYRIDGAA